MFVFSSDMNRGDELLCDTGLNNLLYLRALALLVLRLYAVQESTTHETIIHRRENAFIFSCSRLQWGEEEQWLRYETSIVTVTSLHFTSHVVLVCKIGVAFRYSRCKIWFSFNLAIEDRTIASSKKADFAARYLCIYDSTSTSATTFLLVLTYYTNFCGASMIWWYLWYDYEKKQKTNIIQIQ